MPSIRPASMLAFSLLLSALLSACAYTPDRSSAHWDSVVEAWQGREAIDLWRSWGVPSRVVTAPNGNEMHVYISEFKTRGKRATIYLGHGLAVGGGSSESSGCETAFEVAADKRIVSGYWRGDNCPHAPEDGVPDWIAMPPIGI